MASPTSHTYAESVAVLLYALVGAQVAEEPQVNYTLAGPLPRARVLVIYHDDADGNLYLLRYAADGFVGDTFHLSIDEARQQATFEFSLALGTWQPAPAGLATYDDVRAFAIGLAAQGA